jgi:ABC-type transport system involved in cytochrome c biogenesis permease subunit
MEIKYTIQGLLIYIAIAAYLLAFVTSMLAFIIRLFATSMLFRRIGRILYLFGRVLYLFGRILYLFGFAFAVFAYGYRWYDVRHVPLQNLFEVFLCLGMICYPVSWFCRRVLHVGGRCSDMLIGAIVLFPAGFIFNAQPQRLPPALQSWLFVPHVAVYALSYIFMAKAAVQAALEFAGRTSSHYEKLLPPEQATYRMICVGFPLLTLGLILGSCWGKLAWGDLWGWDPKELWSLASWLVYVGYFHFRFMFGKKHPRINSIWAIIGMLVIVVTLLWVNLSRLFAGLHSYAT